MSSSFATSSLFRFSFPLLLLCILLVGMNNVILVTESNHGFANNLPYILLSVAGILCFTFKQGRMAMVSVTMLIAYIVIQTRLQTPLKYGHNAVGVIFAIGAITSVMPFSLRVPEYRVVSAYGRTLFSGNRPFRYVVTTNHRSFLRWRVRYLE